MLNNILVLITKLVTFMWCIGKWCKYLMVHMAKAFAATWLQKLAQPCVYIFPLQRCMKTNMHFIVFDTPNRNFWSNVDIDTTCPPFRSPHGYILQGPIVKGLFQAVYSHLQINSCVAFRIKSSVLLKCPKIRTQLELLGISS